MTQFAADVEVAAERLWPVAGVGHDPRVLTLAALLVLGVTVLLTGTALGTLVLSIMRRPQGLQSATRRTT